MAHNDPYDSRIIYIKWILDKDLENYIRTLQLIYRCMTLQFKVAKGFEIIDSKWQIYYIG